MKTVLATVVAVAVLGLAAVASANMWGYGGGYGYGGHMMGYGPGHGYATEDREFLEKTADVRRELNTKRFEYQEALRTGDEKKAEKLAKELEELSDGLYAKAPRGRNFARGGSGGGPYCW
jgi:hypothetical protein